MYVFSFWVLNNRVCESIDFCKDILKSIDFNALDKKVERLHLVILAFKDTKILSNYLQVSARIRDTLVLCANHEIFKLSFVAFPWVALLPVLSWQRGKSN